MNKIFSTSIILLSIGVVMSFQSCEDEQPAYVAYEPYAYSSLDENGGNWTPNLLTSSSQIGIPAPTDAASPEYAAELAALKTTSASLTADQQAAVDYWGGDGLVRWNEIARDLSAKYNLPPSPNEDGSYSVPDPANPGNYPYFPFAHPPYSCRMLAYLASAEYDALITAWHYKYQFNRPAPFNADASIVTHLPKNNLPGYPSQGAVIAAVAKDILSAMFPLEKDYIAAKALEHKNSLQWAGLNVPSDITAGDSLGRAVGKVFRMRAAADGMKNAQTSKAVSDSIRDAAQAEFGWHWVNQETPERKVGITPAFGKVKTWFVTDLVAVRPGPPPAPGSVEFNVAADELKSTLDNLTNDQRKIANFWADGIGTYTPPGHWNKFACDYIVQYKYNPLRAARVLAYMNMAMEDAGIACWEAKYHYHYPRPIQTIPGFKTILGTPNFPSYTSGHSMFSAAGAQVLDHIFPAETATIDGWAEEAAVSRIYGGIHYRFDCDAGITAGHQVGQLAVDRMILDGGE
jgi:hypothetical protein